MRDLTDDRHVGWVHEHDVENGGCETLGQLSLNGLIAFLLQIVHPLQLTLLQHYRPRNLLISIISHITSVLSKAELRIVHPAEATDMFVVINELQLLGVGLTLTLVVLTFLLAWHHYGVFLHQPTARLHVSFEGFFQGLSANELVQRCG